MNKLFDLRFVIGAFFTIVAILILVYSLSGNITEVSRTTNRWCGGVFLIFGILMIVFSLRKDAKDDLLEEPSK